MDASLASLQDVLERFDWPADVAATLAASAHVIGYERGASIFHAGEPADLLYVLLSGEVKLYYGNRDGARLLVGIARRGQLLGGMDVDAAARSDDEHPNQFFGAQALSRCTVAIITRARVAAAARQLDTGAVLKLVHRTKADSERLSARMLAFLLMNVRSRLTYAINEVAASFGIDDPRGKLIPLRLSHEDFGEMVGASRPMVSKHLKEFARAGVFYKQDGRYILADRHAAVGPVQSSTSSTRPRAVAERGFRDAGRTPLRLAQQATGDSALPARKAIVGG